MEVDFARHLYTFPPTSKSGRDSLHYIHCSVLHDGPALAPEALTVVCHSHSSISFVHCTSSGLSEDCLQADQRQKNNRSDAHIDCGNLASPIVMGIDANIASKDEEGQERVRLSSAVAGGSQNGAHSGGLHELSRRTSCNPLIRSNTFDTAPGWRGHAAGEQGQTSNASDSDFSAAQADDSGSDFEEQSDDSDYSGNRCLLTQLSWLTE